MAGYCLAKFRQPGRHPGTAQAVAVLGQATDRALRSSQRGANDDERHQHFKQGEAALAQGLAFGTQLSILPFG